MAYLPEAALGRLAGWQAMRRQARFERLEAILDRLDGLGAPVDRAAVTAGLGPDQSPGRPHVARALLAAGHVADRHEAFDRFLADGQPAYVADRGPSAAEAIALVHDLGGLCVVAHPAVDGAADVLDELAALGLDGVEVFHPGHPPRSGPTWPAAPPPSGCW